MHSYNACIYWMSFYKLIITVIMITVIIIDHNSFTVSVLCKWKVLVNISIVVILLVLFWGSSKINMKTCSEHWTDTCTEKTNWYKWPTIQPSMDGWNNLDDCLLGLQSIATSLHDTSCFNFNQVIRLIHHNLCQNNLTKRAWLQLLLYTGEFNLISIVLLWVQFIQ